MDVRLMSAVNHWWGIWPLLGLYTRRVWIHRLTAVRIVAAAVRGTLSTDEIDWSPGRTRTYCVRKILISELLYFSVIVCVKRLESYISDDYFGSPSI